MTPAITLRHPPGYQPERRYAYEVVMVNFLGLSIDAAAENRPDVELRLADGSSEARLRVADVFFAIPVRQWLTNASFPRLPLERISPERISCGSPKIIDALPVLYGDGQAVQAVGDDWRLGIDVFGASFFLLTRYEELVSRERDGHDRFAAAASFAADARLLGRPLVNEYVELLWALLSRLWPRLPRRRRRMTLRLSHDVDLPLCRIPLAEARRLALRDLRRQRAPVVAVRRMATAAFRGRVAPRWDLYNTFDRLMSRSESLGLRSAFYFMAGRTGGAIDGNYRVEEPWILSLLGEISRRGHEIGLHPSYETYLDPDAIRTESRRLMAACASAGVDQRAFGGRQHYLRWANPVTWQAWEDAGLAYDSTLGFADRAGFRTGSCYEYPAFNLETRRPLRLRERPLIVMDASLLEYQRLSLDAAAEEILRLSRVVKHFEGDLTILWHNDRLLSRQSRRAYYRATAGAAQMSAGR